MLFNIYWNRYKKKKNYKDEYFANLDVRLVMIIS